MHDEETGDSKSQDLRETNLTLGIREQKDRRRVDTSAIEEQQQQQQT